MSGDVDTVERAYASSFWEGLMDRCHLEQTRVVHGEESIQFSQRSAQFEANVALARDSLKEVDSPLSNAAWQGYLAGVQRYAALGGPHLPREFESEPAPEPQRSVEQIVWDELDGWMPEFYEDLPRCIDLIRQGVTDVRGDVDFYDTWSFFVNVAAGLDDKSGNFGDGFTSTDRQLINDEVQGRLSQVAELVSRTLRYGKAGRFA